jgi:LuxR family maltose regulon positive regulatory protein
MEMAIPDGFLYLFAVHHWLLQGLSEEMIADKFPEYLELYIKIKERFFIGYNKLHNNLMPDSLTDLLTAREREIALLAAKGLKNAEIAKEMFITENTVRTHLHSAYQKLDIDRRSRLAEKLM